MKLIKCICGHSFMEFVKKTDTWNCSDCKTQRADHMTPFHVIRRIPNTRGARFAIYGVNDEDVTVAAPEQLDSAPETLDTEIDVKELRDQIEVTIAHLYNDEKLATYIKRSGVSPDMRLANTPRYLSEELNLFFLLIEPHINDARHQGMRWTQTQIATALGNAGVMSANGATITNSHVSNCRRKAVLECGPAYSKPDYKTNWIAFR